MNNYVKVTNMDESAGRNIRKFVQIKILNKILNYNWIVGPN